MKPLLRVAGLVLATLLIALAGYAPQPWSWAYAA
jgi:hypothetical protein